MKKQLPKNFQFDIRTDWVYVFDNYIISRNFVKKNKRFIDWFSISRYCDLSENFIRIWKKHINTYGLFFNEKISRKTKKTIFPITFVIKSKRLFFRKKFILI